MRAMSGVVGGMGVEGVGRTAQVEEAGGDLGAQASTWTRRDLSTDLSGCESSWYWSALVPHPPGQNKGESDQQNEDELAVGSGGGVRVPRLVPTTTQPLSGEMRLVPRPRGTLDSLQPVPHIRTTGPHDVKVKVMSVGLNFRDVLNCLDMYPGDPGDPGGDCSGVVVEVGPGCVEAGCELRAGDAVFGLAAGCLATHVVTPWSTMVRMPACVSFEAAAACPTVFSTVDLALDRAAGVRSWDRVLLHAVAGGVGLAAVESLSGRGVEIVGTAGSASKRAWTRRARGVSTVLSSRGVGFTDALGLAPATVVLNSLTSPGMVRASMAGVGAGGRVVEIGKRDVFSAAAVAHDRPDVVYSLVALDYLPPTQLHRVLSRVSARLGAGLRPLPRVVHGFGSVVPALRQLSQARAIGKVVVLRGLPDVRRDG